MTLTTLRPPARRAPGLVMPMSSEGPATIVALRGEADIATLHVVKEVLDRAVRAHDGPVIVELAETRFIDIGTVRLVSQAAKTLSERGRRLTIRSPSRTAVRVMELFGLCDLITSDGDDQ